MEFQKINVTKARIKGLNSKPYYFEHHCYYAWDLSFEDTATLKFEQLPFNMMGNTKEEGDATCKEIKKNFKDAYIHEGEEVAIIFGENGKVLAIGKLGQDVWIDVRDKFTKKTFMELNIVIIALNVY